jgi:hypothetical protein
VDNGTTIAVLGVSARFRPDVDRISTEAKRVR